MRHLLRQFTVGGLIAFAVLLTALELIRHGVDLFAPGPLTLFVIGMAFYLLPTALALYRNCQDTVWIAVTNVFLGWTIFGWVVSLGWAESGRIEILPRTVAASHRHAFLRH